MNALKLIFILVCLCHVNMHSQVGIGTAAPDPSAGLEIDFNNKGLLPPRLTTSEREQIINPAEGLMVYNKDIKCLEVFDGLLWVNICKDLPTNSVLSPTGKIWMDRNLGAERVATSINDPLARGDLFQWGRSADGHEKRNSPTHDANLLGFATTFLGSTGQPWDGKFIIHNNSNNRNWLNVINNSLWNGIAAPNNPCPAGFRVPTNAEFLDEVNNFSPDNLNGAFNSVLKLPATGSRYGNDGSISNLNLGLYYTSTPFSPTSSAVWIFELDNSFITNLTTQFRIVGYAVRCILD